MLEAIVLMFLHWAQQHVWGLQKKRWRQISSVRPMVWISGGQNARISLQYDDIYNQLSDPDTLLQASLHLYLDMVLSPKIAGSARAATLVATRNALWRTQSRDWSTCLLTNSRLYRAQIAGCSRRDIRRAAALADSEHCRAIHAGHVGQPDPHTMLSVTHGPSDK